MHRTGEVPGISLGVGGEPDRRTPTLRVFVDAPIVSEQRVLAPASGIWKMIRRLFPDIVLCGSTRQENDEDTGRDQ
jgi:hypothetical protein